MWTQNSVWIDVKSVILYTVQCSSCHAMYHTLMYQSDIGQRSGDTDSWLVAGESWGFSSMW